MPRWRGAFSWRLADGTAGDVEGVVDAPTIGDALDSDELPEPDIDLDGADVVAITVHLQREGAT